MFGVIKKNNQVVGYKTPSLEFQKEELLNKLKSQKATKEDQRAAEKALEAWAMWRFGDQGYGSSSSEISDRDRLPASSRIPYGVEMSERVAGVIHALKVMESINGVHKNYVFMINTVYCERKNNETLKALFDRLELGFTYCRFDQARKRFAQVYRQNQ